MEKFGERETVLLGSSSYPKQTSFRNSPKSPHSNSGALEMDFNDVFGGPPRRFSNQEVSMRYSFNETVESEEGGSSLGVGNRWSGLDEKPVFGEEEDSYRRQLSGNDFYDDIFRGDSSKSYHSPTSSSFDLLASHPGSRVLSPSCQLPPPNAVELFSSSFPAQLSLPAKLTKAIDYPAFGSANRIKLKNKEGLVSSGMDSPNASSTVVSLSRFSSQAKDLLDDNRSESSINSETFLSRGVSRKSEEESTSSSSFMAESSGVEKRNEVAKDSESYEAPKNSSQFHFSIYRWAGNGVPMLSPLIGSRKWRSTGRRKTERCSSSNGRMDMKMEKFEEYIVSVDSESDSLKVNIEEPEGSSSVVKTKSHDVLSDQHPRFLKPESIQTARERESSNPKIDLDSKGKVGIQTYRDKESFLKPNAKALGDLLSKEEDYGQGIATVEAATTPRANMANMTADIKSRQTNSNVNDISSKRSAKSKGDASIKLRAEGKVREFVKIFNQETSSSPKTKVTSDPQSHSSRWKGIDMKGKENKTRKVADVEVNVHPDKQTKADVSSKDGDNLNAVKVEQETHSNKKSGGLFVDKKNDPNFFDPSPEAKVENNEEFFEGHFQVEELSNIVDKDSHSGGDSADIKALDAKIQQWSSGRKGNIRSLLSTLQYVLWADSGWKPIPLVNLIEGNAVNRAYRKAMLYLHPDKLQQKGAASHQKYTAEKVFEILQEAWDHFNTLGAI